MRLPSIGLTGDERRIVQEGYRLAEWMLRDYEDKPDLFALIGRWLTQLRLALSRD